MVRVGQCCINRVPGNQNSPAETNLGIKSVWNVKDPLKATGVNDSIENIGFFNVQEINQDSEPVCENPVVFNVVLLICEWAGVDRRFPVQRWQWDQGDFCGDCESYKNPIYETRLLFFINQIKANKSRKIPLLSLFLETLNLWKMLKSSFWSWEQETRKAVRKQTKTELNCTYNSLFDSQPTWALFR